MTRSTIALFAIALTSCTARAHSHSDASSTSAARIGSSVSGNSVATAPPSSERGSADAPPIASPGASAVAPPNGEGGSPSEGMAMIPAGVFRMGGTGAEDSPMHDVAIARFELDRTEVTMNAYAECVRSKKCEAPKGDNPFCNQKLEGRGKHPVNCIDYRDAEAYCSFVGKRLPTEREWEYAARGGSEQRTFSWGEELPDKTRACYMHEGGSCEVASFPSGAFGLFDMSGNVWEWTSSWFGAYPDELATGQLKVYRGGSWSRRFPKWLHNELRNRYRTDEDSASLGARCARSVIPLECPPHSTAHDGVCSIDGAVAPPEKPLCGKEPALPCLGPIAKGGAPIALQNVADASSAEPKKDPNNETPIRVRSAEFDVDCGHYPGYPHGFTWRGGTFQAREPLVASSGCKKRDIGVGWTSTCCPE